MSILTRQPSLTAHRHHCASIYRPQAEAEMRAICIPAAAHAIIKVALAEPVHVGGAACIILLAQAFAAAKAELGVLGLSFPAHLLLPWQEHKNPHSVGRGAVLMDWFTATCIGKW